jgi:flagellar biosynthesis GTPase FlhF
MVMGQGMACEVISPSMASKIRHELTTRATRQHDGSIGRPLTMNELLQRLDSLTRYTEQFTGRAHVKEQLSAFVQRMRKELVLEAGLERVQTEVVTQADRTINTLGKQLAPLLAVARGNVLPRQPGTSVMQRRSELDQVTAVIEAEKRALRVEHAEAKKEAAKKEAAARAAAKATAAEQAKAAAAEEKRVLAEAKKAAAAEERRVLAEAKKAEVAAKKKQKEDEKKAKEEQKASVSERKKAAAEAKKVVAPAMSCGGASASASASVPAPAEAGRRSMATFMQQARKAANDADAAHMERFEAGEMSQPDGPLMTLLYDDHEVQLFEPLSSIFKDMEHENIRYSNRRYYIAAKSADNCEFTIRCDAEALETWEVGAAWLEQQRGAPPANKGTEASPSTSVFSPRTRRSLGLPDCEEIEYFEGGSGF